MSNFKLFNFSEIGDERGSLVALESLKNIPIDIERVYYIYGTSMKQERGFHAHKELRQIAICVNGSLDILMDDGNTKETITLDTPSKGLLIDRMQWHVMKNFSPSCVLLVLADDEYRESDYIRDYEHFANEVNNA